MIENGSLFEDRYRIVSYLGQGGMADVYKAYDLINRIYVAIKIVREDAPNKEELYTRFSYEIHVAAAAQNHFNIVRILNYGKIKDNNCPFMVTEFINGQTLRDILDNRGTLDFKESVFLIKQILDALTELHAIGIVHRDIKPQNIYVLSSGVVKIADFGISAFLNKPNNMISEKKVIVGTPQYLAPEIIIDGKVSPQGDIYALGITFFEMITGRVPFNAKETRDILQMQIKNPLPNARTFRPNTPEGIVSIIEKACEKDINDRYQTASEMETDIMDLLSNSKKLKSQNWFERLLGLRGK